MSFLNQQFNTKLIAKRLIVQALDPKFEANVDKIAALIVRVADPLVEQFFFDLSSHMGEVIDLAGQGIPNARPWNPLTLDYIKRKGNSMFWSYTHSMSAQSLTTRLRGKGRRSAAFRGARSDALISTMERIKGLDALGHTTVRIVSVATNTTIKTVSAGSPRSLNQPVSDISSSGVRLEIRLFTKLNRSQLSTIETSLVGVLGEKNKDKLIGHYSHRPLLKPFLAYYSTVVIPQAIEAAVSKRFRLKGTLRVTAA